MNADEYCGFHTVYYFIVMAIGGIFIRIGFIHPVYEIETGAIKTPYSLFFIVFGGVLVFFAFIGLIFFSEIKEIKKNGKQKL